MKPNIVIKQELMERFGSDSKDFEIWRGERGALPNKCRYGCAASVKPRRGKVSPRKPNAWAKRCPKT